MKEQRSFKLQLQAFAPTGNYLGDQSESLNSIDPLCCLETLRYLWYSGKSSANVLAALLVTNGALKSIKLEDTFFKTDNCFQVLPIDSSKNVTV